MAVEPKTILVYSGLELMGDGFMKIPFLRALRAAWPRAHITWLAGKGKTVYAGPLKPLIDAYLDEIIEDAGIGSRLVELLHRPLAGRAFDLVIDTQRRVLTTLILRRLRHRVFVSAAADYLFSDVKPRQSRRKPAAMVQQLLDLVRVASGRIPELAAAASPPTQFDAAAQTLLAADAASRNAIHIGLVPGAGGRHKCWPRERFVAVARHCRASGWRPVFLLGPDERDWQAELAAAVPGALFPLQDPRVPAAIAESPIFTVAIGRYLACAIANDCGTAHMLAAAETPMISLFGPTDAAKFAPLTPDLTILRAQDFGSEAMEAIPLASVLAALECRQASMRSAPSKA